jgi:hypothetical protein
MSDMPVANQDDSQRDLSREWLVARIVIIGGFVVAVVAMVYFGWVQPAMQKRDAAAKAQLMTQESAAAAAVFCNSGLGTAQAFGIVPSYAQIISHNIYLTHTRGRYVCVAATHAAHYLIAVDLFCHDIKKKRCMSLYSVVDQGNQAVLYQRGS